MIFDNISDCRTHIEINDYNIELLNDGTWLTAECADTLELGSQVLVVDEDWGGYYEIYGIEPGKARVRFVCEDEIKGKIDYVFIGDGK